MELYKLVMLGDGGVGKTALTIQVTLNHFVETYDPTIEDSYRKQVVVDNQSCMLEILDTAGQEEYTALRDQWIRDGEAFLLVYSISSRSSFTRMNKFYNQLMRVKEPSMSSPSYPGSPLPSSTAPSCSPICLLVGNKSDRVTEREVSTQEGDALAREIGCVFVEASAKNCVNVEKAFYDLVRLLRTQRLYPSAGSTFLLNTPYTIKRHWWRKSISINPNEGRSAEGRRRLTNSLINAAKSNHERELLAFIDAGANVNGQPGSDGAAIHAASASGHANIVNILLKKGASINARGPSGISPFQMAAAEGHLAVVRLLLHKGAQINQTSRLHGTALSAAASRGRVAVVSFLLKKEANVNIVGGPYGNALQASAWIGNSDIVEALLGAGADINALGDGDCTALQIAAFAGHANVIRSLLELGGALNIDAPGGKYGCALKAADDQGHFEAVTILLKAGAKSTLVPPEETSATDIPTVVDEDETPDNERIEPHALTSPATSSDWPFTPSAIPDISAGDVPRLTTSLPNLTFQQDLLLIRQEEALSNKPSDTTLRRLSSHASGSERVKIPNHIARKKPTIQSIGFSCVSNPLEAIVDIVFVHGLQGHAEKTWIYKPMPPKRRFFSSPSLVSSAPVREAVFWPYDILSQDPIFAQARILTWGYDSKVISEFFGTSDQQNISQHGNDLMVALQQERKQSASRPLIFVAHSLGGILVKVALDNSKRSTHQPQYLPIYDSTKAIIFLGTPHCGSTSTNWGILASNLTKFALQAPSEKVLKGLKPNNEVLENLRKVFLQMLEDNKFKIHSFFETKPMLGLYGVNDRVVPYESAIVGHARQEIVKGINGNHSEICKFKNAEDPGYRAVIGALEDYIMELKHNLNQC